MNPTLTLPDPAKAREYFDDKMAFTTGPMELDRAMRSGEDDLVVVDVRRAEDYRRGHVPGAVSFPHELWDQPAAAGLSPDKLNVLYCYSQFCHLAATAAVELTGHGFPVKELEGGFEGWKASGLKIDSGAPAKSAAHDDTPPFSAPRPVPDRGERAKSASPVVSRRREDIAAGTGGVPSPAQPPIAETGEPEADTPQRPAKA